MIENKNFKNNLSSTSNSRKSRLASLSKITYVFSLLVGSILVLLQPYFWYVSTSMGISSLFSIAFCVVTFLVAAQYNHSKSYEKRQAGVISEMQKRLNYYKSLMANTTQIVTEYDNAGNLLFANAAFQDLVGMEFDESEKKHFNDLVPAWYFPAQQDFFKNQKNEQKKESQSEVP